MTAWIFIAHRIIIAVRKHIVPEKALSRAAVGVCVEEALHNGVIISALEVVEARLRELIVPANLQIAGLSAE